jgi:hypothetical protein
MHPDKGHVMIMYSWRKHTYSFFSCCGIAAKITLLLMKKSFNLKRKEHAQEVEVVSVYNKRLRKSFFKTQNVSKRLRRDTTQNISKTPPSNPAELDDFSSIQEADSTPSFTGRSSDAGKNQKRTGKVHFFV